MGQYAEKFGLEEKGVKGMDQEFIRGTLNRQFMGIAQQGLANKNAITTNAMNRGMEHSGSVQKMQAMNIGEMTGQALEAESQMAAANESYKLENQSRWLNVLSHEDNYRMNQEQMQMQKDAMSGDWLDTISKVGSLVALL